MKTKLTLLLTLFVATVIFGQNKKDLFRIKKGTWLLEGDFSINFANQESSRNFEEYTESNSFGFKIAPKIGCAINDNLVVGLGLGYSYNESEGRVDDSHTDYTNIGYFVSSYLKKFIPLSSRLAFHLEGGIEFGNSKNKRNHDKDVIDEERYTSKRVAVVIRPGMDFMVAKNVLLELNFGSFGYVYSQYNNDYLSGEYTSTSNSIGFNINSSSLLLGVSILL